MKEQVQSVSDLRSTPKGTLLPKEVASVLGVDLRTVYGAIDEGQIPAIQVGRLKLVPKPALMKLLGIEESQDADAA